MRSSFNQRNLQYGENVQFGQKKIRNIARREFRFDSSTSISVLTRRSSTCANSPPISSTYVNSKYINLPQDAQKNTEEKGENHLGPGSSLSDQGYIYDRSPLSSDLQTTAKRLDRNTYSNSALSELSMKIKMDTKLKEKKRYAIVFEKQNNEEQDLKNTEEVGKPRKRRTKNTRTLKVYKTKTKDVEVAKAKAIETIRRISGLVQNNHPSELNDYRNHNKYSITSSDNNNTVTEESNGNLPRHTNFTPLPACSGTSSSSTFTTTNATIPSRKVVPPKVNDNHIGDSRGKSRLVTEGKEENVTKLTRKFRLWNPFAEKRKALDQRYKQMVTNTINEIINSTKSKGSSNKNVSTSLSSNEIINASAPGSAPEISHLGTPFYDTIQLLHLLNESGSSHCNDQRMESTEIMGEKATSVQRQEEKDDSDLNLNNTNIDKFLQVMQKIEDITSQNKSNCGKEANSFDQKKISPSDPKDYRSEEKETLKLKVGSKIAAWIRRRQLEEERIEARGTNSKDDDHAIEVLLTAKSKDIDKFFAKLERERKEEEERLNKDLEEEINNLCRVFENGSNIESNSNLDENYLALAASDESFKVSMIEMCIEEMKLNSPSRIVGFDTEWKPA